MHPVDSPSQTLEAEPHASNRPIVVTLIVLLLLTLISWAVSNLELGAAGTAVALGIAVVKASAVLYVFMELPLESTVARIVVIVTLSFIALLCAGTLTDIDFR